MTAAPRTNQKRKEAYFTASQGPLIWARFRRNRSAMIAAVVLIGLILMGFFAPFLSPYDPNIAGRDKDYQDICGHVAVMYLGWLVKTAPTRDLFAAPRPPYTKALMSAIPSLDPDNRGSAQKLEGEIPSPTNPPPGCKFNTRCPSRSTSAARRRRSSTTSARSTTWPATAGASWRKPGRPPDG